MFLFAEVSKFLKSIILKDSRAFFLLTRFPEHTFREEFSLTVMNNINCKVFSFLPYCTSHLAVWAMVGISFERLCAGMLIKLLFRKLDRILYFN